MILPKISDVFPYPRQSIAPASLGLILALGFVSPILAQIAPNGAGTVVSPQGNQINISGGIQAGGNLFHSFQDFNVNSGQVANFLSNPQTQNILGRINGGNPSFINGLLQVTGGNSNLFLMNPAGIIFGQGANLNIPASFTATTANGIGFGNNVFNAFGDNNFSALIGNPNSFVFNTTQAGSIVNAGNLAVGNGQNISLIAGNTINTGRLTASGGEIQLLAVPGTNLVRLSQPGQVLSLEIVPPVDGTLRAVDLPALLTGRDLPGIVVNPSGQVQVAGTTLPNQQGIAVASGRIDVSSTMGNGGTVQVLGNRVAVLDARINANGATGGGTVRLGGEYLGGRDTGIAPALRFNSQRTLVDRNSLIRANATVSGEGGRVIVWADRNTGYFGRITGRGGTGRGAFVEISGRENLAFDGRVEIPGANGLFGSLLLDPLNVVISAAATDNAQIADGIIGAGEAPGATWFISQTAFDSVAGGTPISIAATNNIDFQTTVNLSAFGIAPVTFTAPTITASAGAVTLYTNGRNVTLTANSIDAANLSIETRDYLVRSGTIQATANSGNLTLGLLNTRNDFISAGAITLNAPLGAITTGEIDARTFFNTGNGGAISLTSQGAITTGDILSLANNADGNGGAISLTTSQGAITTGLINSEAIYGNGGAINLTSQGAITTGEIRPRSSDGNSGDINLTSQGAITTGLIRGGVQFTFGSTGNVGVINLTSQGAITTGDILSIVGNGAGNGGAINLTSQGAITTGDIGAAAFGGTGNGGVINLISQGAITTRRVSVASNNNGGTINLYSQGNITTTGEISSRSDTSGNGGAISLTSLSSIVTSDLGSYGNGSGNSSGAITINAGNLFRVLSNGFCGAGISICSGGVNGATNGAVTINHGGGITTPFVVGNSTTNGTAGAINAGTGNIINTNFSVPVPPTTYTQGIVQIITTTPPVVPPVVPPLVPPPASPSISPEILPLLQNPTAPVTPAPVVVGTPPPILIPETTPLLLPIPTPLIPPSLTVVIAPPVVPTIIIPTLPPSLPPSPSPAPPAPILSRPILDANSPGAQSPVSLATANSSIPIIDRIPVDSQNNKIRLLDDPFKTEFQLFSGISDEIATLDVNQAQEILQRIMRETNTKPVFIYVFFAPENDTERTVNSARGLTSPLRVAQDTDILEVVLVPPTGDLVRVKYPGLKRPDVMNTAQRFVSLTSNRSNGYIGSARQFHEWIIAPLQEELKKREIDNLVFLMDVGLRSIPLAAMRDKQNGDRFIIEDYSVGLMPSLTLTDTNYTSLRGSEVLGMGAATFVGANPLPGVPLELNTINQLWGGNTLINENFTLSNLRQARRPAQRIVHLATHGVFAPGEKSNSYIQLWGNERLTLDQIRQAGWGTPPVDLLVLSACQTALGDREAELGFAGLAVQAGVKSALASLWLVSDEGTLGLMTEFYKQLQETTTKSEALRQAQLAMLRGEVRLEGGNLVTPQGMFPLNEELKRLGDRSLRHPYFWSAFTMIGNPW
jgi:filamentous hemagglutinin family protein